jgi:hypothetical protein
MMQVHNTVYLTLTIPARHSTQESKGKHKSEKKKERKKKTERKKGR